MNSLGKKNSWIREDNMEWIELKRKNIAILKGIWLIMISMDLPLTASFKQNLWLNTAPLEGMWFDIRRWPGTERAFVKNWMKENSKPSRLFSGENKLDWELIQKGEDVMICLLWRRYPKWILYANSVSSMFLLRHSEEIPYFLSGNRNFFYIYYEEIHHVAFRTSQQG